MRTMLIAAIALALACGGSEGSQQQANPPPPPSLNSGIAGTWNGTTTLTSPGQAPASYYSRLVVAVTGQSAIVANVCPDASGTVTLTGSDNTASWSGTLSCPAIVGTTCVAIFVTYHSASLTLNSNGTLTAQGAGALSGCGVTLALTTTFVGSK